jgi:hypothetical protein
MEQKFKLLFPLILIAIAAIPYTRAFYNIGSHVWAGTWNNEVRFWGLVLSTFAIAGIVYAYRNLKNYPGYFLLLNIFAFIVIILPFFDLLSGVGFGASSKADSEELEIWSFWGI